MNPPEHEPLNLPSSNVLILKSIPIVEMNDELNVLSANLKIMHVFPTPLSPISSNLKNKSKFFAIAECISSLVSLEADYLYCIISPGSREEWLPILVSSRSADFLSRGQSWMGDKFESIYVDKIITLRQNTKQKMLTETVSLREGRVFGERGGGRGGRERARERGIKNKGGSM